MFAFAESNNQKHMYSLLLIVLRFRWPSLSQSDFTFHKTLLTYFFPLFFLQQSG